MAPPEISDEDAQGLIDAFDKMHQTEAWKTAVERNGWIDAFMSGDEFGTYLADQATDIKQALEGVKQ